MGKVYEIFTHSKGSVFALRVDGTWTTELYQSHKLENSRKAFDFLESHKKTMSAEFYRNSYASDRGA